MPADAVISRELKSLQEELTASQRERLGPPASTTDATAAASGATASAAPVKETADEHELRDQLQELL
jgi:hypothetical protein